MIVVVVVVVASSKHDNCNVTNLPPLASLAFSWMLLFAAGRRIAEKRKHAPARECSCALLLVSAISISTPRPPVGQSDRGFAAID